jgi:HD-like signal output (HDOD) protein
VLAAFFADRWSVRVANIQIQSPSNAAFEFVRSLAEELSSGKIELPSFPEIAVQVRKLLADPNASIAQVVRVVGSEPALAARLMRVANASAFNRSGRPITDLRTAINRIGYSMVRSAAIAFAMSQMRRGSKLKEIEPQLNALWRQSTLVAAFAYVLARSCSSVNPDEAMLTGMMHGIGKLYILTRAAEHAELFTDEAALEDILDQWHASVGKAILENWEFADAMSQAVGEQDHHGGDEELEPDLSDVVAVAVIMASYQSDVPGLELALNGLPPSIRLGLDEARIRSVIEESAAEVTALSDALAA